LELDNSGAFTTVIVVSIAGVRGERALWRVLSAHFGRDYTPKMRGRTRKAEGRERF
jgi:hypothetical protein